MVQFRKGDQNDISNFKSISLESVFVKVFEAVVILDLNHKSDV